MAIVNLSDEALLVRHPAEAPRLTSRVTGNAVHLNEEQVVVVTLLGDGPLEVWELVSRAKRYHGLQLDQGVLKGFIAELERMGLLWLEEHTSEELPHGAANHQSSNDFIDSLGAPPINESDALLGEPAPWLSDAEDLASDGTEVVAMDGILGQFPMEVAEPTSPHNKMAAEWESDVTVDGQESMQQLAAQDAAVRAEAMLAPAVAAAPSAAPQHAQVPALDRAPLPGPSPTPSQAPAQTPMSLLANLQAPTPGSESKTRPDLPGSDPLPGAEPAGLPDKSHPYPLLVRRWMPKLRPKSKNVLLTDPGTGARRELKVWEYQLARMMDGFRSPDQLVDSARTVGLILHLDEILTITARLVREEILAPGTTPLTPPPALDPAPGQPLGNAPGRPDGTDLSKELEAFSSPFQDLGDSPDSIVDSLISVPGRQRKRRSKPNTTGPVQLPAQPLQQARQTDLEVSLKMLATFEEQDRHAEANVALQHLLERNPHLSQALAAMKRLGGTETSTTAPARRSLVPWIAVGAAGLLLIGLLIASLVIKVETSIALPCRTVMIQRGSVTSTVSGKITALVVKKGDVISKQQPLVRVSDEAKKRQINELKPQIADKQELVRIMRTTGTVADERKQKQIVAKLSARLTATSRGCRSARCRGAIVKITASLESAKRKLKFCEWQAEPDEIKRVADEIAGLEQTLAKLSAQPLESVARSSSAGLVTSVMITKGAQLTRGAKLVTLADSKRLRVTAWDKGKRDGPRPVVGVPASVRLVGQGSDQTYKAIPADARPGGPLAFEVVVDLLKVPANAACQVELQGEPISLLGSWFK
jgi:multidrug efflux pump subunit AcrA (membrane-fusion protein)